MIVKAKDHRVCCEIVSSFSLNLHLLNKTVHQGEPTLASSFKLTLLDSNLGFYSRAIYSKEGYLLLFPSRKWDETVTGPTYHYCPPKDFLDISCAGIE